MKWLIRESWCLCLFFLGLQVALRADAAAPGRLTADDARHLLVRTGFAPTCQEVEAITGQRGEAAVTALVNRARAHQPRIPAPGWTTQPPDRFDPGRGGGQNPQAMMQMRAQQYSHAAEFKNWWFAEMAGSPAPLAERMVLFWHGHFATSQQKVIRAHAMWHQHTTLRRHALGNFREMLHAMARDPAMLVYLDGATSRKGAPNENFAREVMELFTLGEAGRGEGMGGYTEQDIKEAARAFTGWSVEREDFSYRYRPFAHDEGQKTLFGQSGHFSGEQVLDLLLDSPRLDGAAARFVVSKLWREFVSPQPQAQEVERLASQFRRSRYDIAELLTELLLSDAFWDARNRASLIKSPIDLVVGALRQLEFQWEDLTPLVLKSAQLGQNLWMPPNVKGWPGHTDWVNATTLLERKRLAEQLLRSTQSGAQPAAASSLAQDRAALREVLRPAERHAMARMGPAMQTLRFDAQAFLQQCGMHTDRVPGLGDRRCLERTLLLVEPTQAISEGTVGVHYLRALMMDPAYQLK